MVTSTAVTVTVQVAVTLGSALAAAVMVAVPTLLAVTRPVSSTVATSSSEEDQVTEVSARFQGAAKAVSRAETLGARDRVS